MAWTDIGGPLPAGRVFTVDEMVECIEAVSADQIRTISQDFFAGKQVGLVALGRTNGVEFTPEELVC